MENKSSFEYKYIAFRKKHPVLHIINAFGSMFLPFVLVALAALLSGAEDIRSGFGIYALAGSFVLGIGLVLCVWWDYNKIAIWRFCVYPIGVGALIVAKNLIFIYKKDLGFVFTEELLSFQLCSYFLVFFFAVNYYLARDAIKDYMGKRYRIKAGRLEDMTEGLWNGLFFTKLRKKHGIGDVFFFNLAFVLVYLLFLAGTVLVLYIPSLAIFVTSLGMILTASVAYLIFFAYIISRKTQKSYFTNGKRRLFRNSPLLFTLFYIAFNSYFCYIMIKRFMAL